MNNGLISFMVLQSKQYKEEKREKSPKISFYQEVFIIMNAVIIAWIAGCLI